MQLTKTLWVSAGSNQRFSACRDRPVARNGPKSNWARTIGIPDLLVVGNLDRRWLAALVWTLETNCNRSLLQKCQQAQKSNTFKNEKEHESKGIDEIADVYDANEMKADYVKEADIEQR